MKKTIILVILTVCLLSCSKDEGTPNPNLELNFTNLLGKWYLKEEIQADGTIEPHTSYCVTQRDYVEFFVNGYIDERKYYSNCQTGSDGKYKYYIDNETKIFYSYSTYLPDGKIIKFTNEEIHLQFDYDATPVIENLKTLILTRN